MACTVGPGVPLVAVSVDAMDPPLDCIDLCLVVYGSVLCLSMLSDGSIWGLQIEPDKVSYRIVISNNYSPVGSGRISTQMTQGFLSAICLWLYWSPCSCTESSFWLYWSVLVFLRYMGLVLCELFLLMGIIWGCTAYPWKFKGTITAQRNCAKKQWFQHILHRWHIPMFT